MDTPVEPLACVSTFSAEAGGLHFLWGGQTEKTISIGVYDVQTEQWTLTHTTGPPPPGLRAGGCVIITNNLYCFGGYDGSSLFNDLYKLNLETRQWSKVYPKSNLSEQPICKAGCSLAAVDKRTLVCFGGYGSEPTHVQPGSTFTRDYQIRGWTNEFHLFDTQEGIIISHHYVFSCVCKFVLISLSSHMYIMSCSTHSCKQPSDYIILLLTYFQVSGPLLKLRERDRLLVVSSPSPSRTRTGQSFLEGINRVMLKSMISTCST